ncbi:ATP-binding protein [Labedella populi]|uniref:ATP-binding protein n=1 Tax=Labedella populi TaxID=2498850 RepID=A0A3S3ZGZ0_9MICO|nr:AAA family ATPase [Labedella populi]RWZ59284.1 ATP-binding protein [Labedella populi]
MLLWINGTFGVGKTHVAHELHRQVRGSVVSDPELLGIGIQRMYPPELRVDFQETPWWTPTIAELLADLALRHPGPVIVPMTLADPDRHETVFRTLHSAGVETHHVTLLASRDSVRRRVRARFEDPEGWPLQHFDDNDAALRTDRFATHVETDRMSLPEVVEAVGGIAGILVAYSRADRLGLPLRRARITFRHIR